MGAFGHRQDPHAGLGFSPKLILTGALSGSFAGRPVEIVCEGRCVRLVLPSVRTAWRLRRGFAGLPTVASTLDRVGIALSVSVGGATLPVLPNPHPLVRWFGPELGGS